MGPRAQQVINTLDDWYPERNELRDPIRSTRRWLQECALSSTSTTLQQKDLNFYIQTNDDEMTGLVVLELPRSGRRSRVGVLCIRRTIVPPSEQHGRCGAGTRLLQVGVYLLTCVILLRCLTGDTPLYSFRL